MNIGIEYLGFHVPQYFVDLGTVAAHRDVAVEKYYDGIGQEKMSIPPHCQDVVTLAANAAHFIIERNGTETIDTVIFCTETGIDQSKSAGIYVARLLGLKQTCRNVEMKQACYSATAALQLACGYVARKPDKKVLVIASDISRYELGSKAEPSQGCGAVAMLISAQAKILAIDPVSGLHSEDVMDFWRPNYRKTPLVNSRLSTQKYLQALTGAWHDYQAAGGRHFDAFAQFCYHLPFTRMGEKAHLHLCKINSASICGDAYRPGLAFNRVIGNSYTASLYISLVSALKNCKVDLANKPVALFSYGSGCVGEFLSGVVQIDYDRYICPHQDMLEARHALDYETYLKYWHAPDPGDGISVDIQPRGDNRYRLVGIHDGKRIYDAEKR